MPSNSFDGDRIGPDVALADVALPPHVGERMAALYGREERIANGAEWIAATARAVGAGPESAATEADLCHARDGAHTVDIDGERDSFVCVLDPLVVPFLRERPGTVRSESQVDGDPVVVEIGRDRATATPETAVVSLGVSHAVEADGDVTPERIYGDVCPYVHAFATPAEYDRWADDVAAATTSVSIQTGVALAGAIATELFA